MKCVDKTKNNKQSKYFIIFLTVPHKISMYFNMVEIFIKIIYFLELNRFKLILVKYLLLMSNNQLKQTYVEKCVEITCEQ